MKTKQVIIVLSAAAGGLLMGYAVRHLTGRSLSESRSITLIESDKVSTKAAVGQKFDDSPLANKLEHDLSISSGVTRWLCWWQAIEHAELADMPRLARLANGDNTAIRLVAERWIELDPRNLFDTLIAAQSNHNGLPVEGLANALLSEWPRRDAKAAVAALSGTEAFGLRPSWRQRVAGVLCQSDVELGIRCLGEWHIENYSPNMKGVSKWAAADPQHAAEFVSKYPVGYATLEIMEAIAAEWAKTDAPSALAFAATERNEYGSQLAKTALNQWAERSLKGAAEWLAGTDKRTQNALSPAFATAWGKQDAPAALAWCQANLTGGALAESMGAVLGVAAEKDPKDAAELVNAMPPSRARTEAATAVAAKWFPDTFSNKPIPNEAINWLAKLDDESLNRVLKDRQWSWAENDPKSLAAFISTDHRDGISPDIANQVARKLAKKDPADAIKWVETLPGSSALSAGAAAFTEWQHSQSESAFNWLHQLAAQDPRREKFFQGALQDIIWSPDPVARLADLSEADRLLAQKLLPQISIATDQRQKVLDALKSE